MLLTYAPFVAALLRGLRLHQPRKLFPRAGIVMVKLTNKLGYYLQHHIR